MALIDEERAKLQKLADVITKALARPGDVLSGWRGVEVLDAVYAIFPADDIYDQRGDLLADMGLNRDLEPLEDLFGYPFNSAQSRACSRAFDEYAA